VVNTFSPRTSHHSPLTIQGLLRAESKHRSWVSRSKFVSFQEVLKKYNRLAERSKK
jgi:hypothetical protein